MPASDLPDEQLVSLSKDGNLGAFNSLVARYQDAVYTLCLRLLGERPAAEDATQEAFLSAYRAIRSFHGGNLRSWLFRIAANECKDELRRRSRRGLSTSFDVEGIPEPIDPAPSSDERLEIEELGSAIQDALNAIPFEQRQVVVLVDVFELPYEEAAGLLGVAVGTVRSRLHRGRERLRRHVLSHPELFGRRGRLKE